MAKQLIIDGVALRPKAIELQEAIQRQGYIFSNAHRDRVIMECKAKNSARPLLDLFKAHGVGDAAPAMSEAEVKKVLGAAIRDSHYAKLADGLLRTGFSQSVVDEVIERAKQAGSDQPVLDLMRQRA